MRAPEYAQDPWKEANCHEAYTESFLHMRPAPEYACGEVVLASVYRNVGFTSEVTEGKVPKLGRQLQSRLDKGKAPKDSPPLLAADAWKGILQGALKTPKQPNQTAKRFLQVCPLVPDSTIYSMSPRLSTNSWNPGQLVARTLAFGSPSEDHAARTWEKLFSSLSVTSEDDIWAQFLDKEFKAWRPPPLVDEWSEAQRLPRFEAIQAWRDGAPHIPATSFSRDLNLVLDLKPFLTRRQWTSMMESVLRLGTASHVLWLCHANAACLQILEDVLGGAAPPTEEKLKSQIGMPAPYLRYGQRAMRTIKDSARSFIVARACINLILWNCNDKLSRSDGGQALPPHPLDSIASLSRFCVYLAENRKKFPLKSYHDQVQTAIDADPRVMACKRGIGSNITEFLGHVLHQRQTSEQGMDSYDQGYYLRKHGGGRRAPWVAEIGPVSALTLVHCCTHSFRGPRTVLDLCGHLAGYGLEVTAQDLDETDLGMTLRNLGLVLDSPDAEGGMVLVSPFTQFIVEEGR
jgi:hypothetical protein